VARCVRKERSQRAERRRLIHQKVTMSRKPPEITHEQVLHALDGDRQAVVEIVRAFERPIYNIALRMLLHPHDAEDATQESLIRIVTRLGQYRAEASFSTWAFRVAVRRILDFREQRGDPTFSFSAFEADLADGRDDDAVERAEDAILHRQL